MIPGLARIGVPGLVMGGRCQPVPPTKGSRTSRCRRCPVGPNTDWDGFTAVGSSSRQFTAGAFQLKTVRSRFAAVPGSRQVETGSRQS